MSSASWFLIARLPSEQGVLVEEREDGHRKWTLASMQKYMRDESDPSMALGLVSPHPPKSSARRPAEKPTNLTSSGGQFADHQLESAGEESSPSWASSSNGNTPSYGSGSTAFEFGGTKVASEESPPPPQGTPVITTTQCTPTSTPVNSGHRRSDGAQGDEASRAKIASSDLLAALVSEPARREHGKMRKGSADSGNDTSNGESQVGTPSKGSKLSRLLRRTHSAGCSKDVPSHALFMKEKPPVTKTKSAESAPCTREDADEKLKRNRKTLAQDMKMRLSFLRRRHTDSALQPSVRPTPEEAQKWTQSFQELTNSKYGLSLFRAFLSREFSEENIEFWLACEDFKRSRPNKLTSKAKKIYEDFVAVQSPKEVNLDSGTRATLLNVLQNPDHHSFDGAQRRIQGIMEQDAYIRFLQSDLYMELLDGEPEQDTT